MVSLIVVVVSDGVVTVVIVVVVAVVVVVDRTGALDVGEVEALEQPAATMAESVMANDQRLMARTTGGLRRAGSSRSRWCPKVP